MVLLAPMLLPALMLLAAPMFAESLSTGIGDFRLYSDVKPRPAMTQCGWRDVKIQELTVHTGLTAKERSGPLRLIGTDLPVFWGPLILILMVCHGSDFDSGPKP